MKNKTILIFAITCILSISSFVYCNHDKYSDWPENTISGHIEMVKYTNNNWLHDDETVITFDNGEFISITENPKWAYDEIDKYLKSFMFLYSDIVITYKYNDYNILMTDWNAKIKCNPIVF